MKLIGFQLTNTQTEGNRMNNKDLTDKVHALVSQRLYKEGIVSIPDILMDLDYLKSDMYRLWKDGKVPYLEKVCHTNLSKLTLISKEVRKHCLNKGCKESHKEYRANKSKRPLRFSKSGDWKVERAYSACYIDTNRRMQLKKQKDNKKDDDRSPDET